MSNYKEQGEKIRNKVKKILKEVKELKIPEDNEYDLGLILSLADDDRKGSEGCIMAKGNHVMALALELMGEVTE